MGSFLGSSTGSRRVWSAGFAALSLLAGVACGGSTKSGRGQLSDGPGAGDSAGAAGESEFPNSGGRDASGGRPSASGGRPSGGEVSSGGTLSGGVSMVHTGIAKIDLLLVVDNSRGMGHKQALLRASLPAFFTRLTSPRCIDSGNQPTGEISENGVCTEGRPEFPPLADIHIGVITSSLGDMGSGEVCPPDLLGYDDAALLVPNVRPLEPVPGELS